MGAAGTREARAWAGGGGRETWEAAPYAGAACALGRVWPRGTVTLHSRDWATPVLVRARALPCRCNKLWPAVSTIGT